MAQSAELSPSPAAAHASPWSELLHQEDWWAIWIGLGLVAAALVLFANGGSIKWLAIAPQKWTHTADVGAQLQAHGVQYAALFVLWVRRRAEGHAESV